MVGESIQSALVSLKAERDRIDGAIASLEGFVSGGSASAGGGKRRIGRPPRAAGAAPAAKSVGKRKNAPRGLLKKCIHEALKKAGKVLAPVVLTEAVMKSGYPNKNKKTLYTAIFAAAKKDPAIKKTGDGFALK